MQTDARARVSRAFFFALFLSFSSFPALAGEVEDCQKLSGEPAIKACTAAIATKKFKGPQLSDLYFRRGAIHYNLDMNDRALQDFNGALIHNPANGAAYSGRGSVHVDNKDYDRALSDFTMSIQIDKTNAYAFENRGDVFMRQGKFKEAASDYDSALKLSPENPWSVYGRGIAKLKAGDKSGEADLATAKKMNAKVAEEYTDVIGVKP